jgi:pimeloyl-ACP methyl ester carboxylesterase
MEFVSPDGVRLHASEHGPPDAPPLILLHGLGSDAQSNAAVIDAIGPRLHVAALDLRGHGESEPLTDPARYGWFDAPAADAVQLADLLEWERCTLAGGSLGAATATAAVLRAPSRFRALGLLAPALGAGPATGNAVAPFLFDGIREHGLIGFLDWLLAANPGFLPPEAEREVRANWGRQDDAAMRACVTALAGAVLVERLDELRAIEQPTIVVAHRNDPLHPWDFAVELAECVPNATLAADDVLDDPSKLAEVLVGLATP